MIRNLRGEFVGVEFAFSSEEQLTGGEAMRETRKMGRLRYLTRAGRATDLDQA
jgi:hypothetical protein